MSKAIYKPKGKAGEYADWACNLYVGCSNNCSYCYCKKGLLSHAMGGPEAKLKACFKDEENAFEVFKKELHANLEELRKSSLFFTFSSDPLIPETRELNVRCIKYAIENGVKVQVLTKNADFYLDEKMESFVFETPRDMVAFGFTLTGRDDLEPGASTNKARCCAMDMLYDLGYRTFASLEPVVEPARTAEIADEIFPFCDMVKVGLMSGVPASYYNREDVVMLANHIAKYYINEAAPIVYRSGYMKRSLTDFLGLPAQKPIDIFSIEHK